MKEQIKSKSLNEKTKSIIKDLSLFNGLTEKINLDYFKNFKHISLFNINEMSKNNDDNVLSNKETSIYIPFMGEIIIKPNTMVLDNNTTFSYKFIPSSTFNKNVKDAYNDEIEIINDFADKYKEKILNLYEKFLNE